MNSEHNSFAGMKITVMGLGLHGGGIATARFLAGQGAELTVTDLRDEETLRPSMEQLRGLPIRYVMGRHEMEDFSGADMVIKNPAVRRSSPYLKAARRVETDLTLFLRLNRRPVLAVTGSKGKSTTVSVLHAIAKREYPEALLGGNITISPLSFVQ
ncbi:MAG: UDP-N-acetylmuramoyl-L-alanine--D-glutamate ligase, partial [Spirochaetota bacterium]|nr:UDP-N-acetylmuramoyl-L-alanine--D-glutamate ligase [Spirochaetota bacterium]